MFGVRTALRRAVHKVDTLHRIVMGCPPRLVEGEISGHHVVVRKGALREKADYDDAWLFCAAAEARRIFDGGIVKVQNGVSSIPGRM